MSVWLGVIGVGAAGRVHVRNAMRIAGVELAAVAGTTRERAHRVAECAGDGTRACTPQEITRSPDIDAVVLATPFDACGPGDSGARVGKARAD